MDKKFEQIYISPTTGTDKNLSWEDKINESCSPLAGYRDDLKQGGVDGVLNSLFNLQDNDGNYCNFNAVKNIYLEHIRKLQTPGEDDASLQQKAEIMGGESMNPQVISILKDYGILPGITLYIPLEKRNIVYNDVLGDKDSNNPNNNSSYKVYQDNILTNRAYSPIKESIPIYTDLRLAVQVLVYSKAQDRLFDITNYISSLQTNVIMGGGGTFSMKMHLASMSDIKNHHHLPDNNLNILGYVKAQQLQAVFSNNDLIFIRFEKLECEPKLNEKEYLRSLDKQLVDKYWDLIGLIGDTKINSTADNLNLTITGQDLTKLLVEDKNMFFSIQFGDPSKTIFGGQTINSINRLFSTGEYNIEFLKSFKSIGSCIGFILSQLTNIEILNDGGKFLLKREYGNKLSRKFTYTQSGRQEESTPIDGIWGLIDYKIDERVSHYRLADASLSNPNGSVYQQILKVCQYPFVELVMDTFVNKYQILVRRPPILIKDIHDSKYIVIPKLNSLSDNISFEKNFYTVYQMTCQGGCFAATNSLALNFLPIVILDNYMKIWGNKVCNPISDYVNIDLLTQQTENKNNLKDGFIDDLIWLINSTAYLPFSRTGTITIRGDRRIKIGQWIYYEKTNELFYVNGISNSCVVTKQGITRTTTLTVSRGLIFDYLEDYGRLIDNNILKSGLKNFIADTNKVEQPAAEGNSEQKVRGSQSIVNTEKFNFFLQGKQFAISDVAPYIDYSGKAAMGYEEIKSLRMVNKKQYANQQNNVL